MTSQVRVSRWIGLGLFLITVAAYSGVVDCEFVDFDDQDYVILNSLVQGGFSFHNVGRTFSSFHAANWHPLTWLSLMTDFQLFGLNPSAFHLVNLILHAANVLLLFIALFRMTSQPWRSGMVAALFAVHPLHVESVAWVAERKDVLCALFWMLVLISYHGYACRPAMKRYLLVMVFYALGLMSKSMVVTLPCVLLLMDVWPLRRINLPFLKRTPLLTSTAETAPSDQQSPRLPDNGSAPQISVTIALLEKVPLLLLTGVACYLTIRAQSHTIDSATQYVSGSWKERISNALISYVVYLEKTIWPVGLCCFYPYDVNRWSAGGHVLAIVLLAILTYVAIASLKKNPAIFVGWFWYLGTLVPVIGLIQVGDQAMADRYTYLPLIGVFIAVVWGLPQALGRRPIVGLTTVLTAVILFSLVMRCRDQVATWKNTRTLFQHAYAVNPRNWRAAFFLAEDFKKNGQINNAVKHYCEAASLLPKNDAFQEICGSRLAKIGKFADAAECFAAAVQIDPGFADHHRHLGLMLVQLRQLNPAAIQFQDAIRLKPDDAAAHSNFGAVLMEFGRFEQAEQEMREALRLNPKDLFAAKNLEILSGLTRRNPAP